MAADNGHPTFGTLINRVGSTTLGALQNRTELLMVEVQEEKGRILGLLIWGVGLLFLAVMAMMLLTATIIFSFREELRVYVALGFFVLYLGGAVAAIFSMKSLLNRTPFGSTLAEFKKDADLLDSLK
jgi:uncharacterized membrane protein YqjE